MEESPIGWRPVTWGVIRFCVTAVLCEEKSTDGLSTNASFVNVDASCEPASLNSQPPLQKPAVIDELLPSAADDEPV